MIWFVKDKTININPYKRILIVSFIYTLFFGIGIIGASHADPGFVLPFPVTISLIDDISRGWDPYYNLCFFVFWWIVISAIKLYLYWAKKRDSKQQIEPNETSTKH
jgi:hypothetical protein